MRIVCTVLLLALPLFAVERRVIVPAGAAKPVGPYSPGILSGNFLYVSGQGVRRADGSMPGNIAEQARQCMENVKAIVEAAGLAMDHIVYTQVYLNDMSTLPAVDEVYRSFFQRPYPARVIIGVERMPTDTTVEINAVAARDRSDRRAIGVDRKGPVSPAMAAGGRLYVSGIYARTQREAEQQLGDLLKQSGFTRRQAVFVKRYGPSGIPVKALPGGASAAITGIWDRARKQGDAGCRAAGDTVYCEAVAAPGPDIDAQVRAAMGVLGEGLKSQGLGFEHAVSANVYLDDLDDFQRMNKVYATYFTASPPTRTTVQPAKTSESPLVRISLIAVQ